jgi:hypothetical protein
VLRTKVFLVSSVLSAAALAAPVPALAQEGDAALVGARRDEGQVAPVLEERLSRRGIKPCE